MLTIILTILKVIGIIIGIILGILLLLIAEILWVPFRYKLIAKKEEDFSVQVKLHWLLRFIFVDLTYENSKLVFLIRVLGYRVYDSRRPKKEKKRKNNNNKKKSKKRSGEKESKKIDIKPQTLSSKSEEPEILKQAVVEDDEIIQSKNPSKQKPASMKNRIRRILTSIKSFPGKVKIIFVHVRDKVKKIIRTIVSFPSKIKTFIFDETTTSAFSLIWKAVCDLLRAIGPRRVYGHIEFGLEDPCSTGKVLGMISVVLAFFNIKPKKVCVTPDFTQARLSGEIKAVGRVYSFTVLRLFLKLYRDENMKQLKQRIDQFKEG